MTKNHKKWSFLRSWFWPFSPSDPQKGADFGVRADFFARTWVKKRPFLGGRLWEPIFGPKWTFFDPILCRFLSKNGRKRAKKWRFLASKMIFFSNFFENYCDFIQKVKKSPGVVERFFLGTFLQIFEIF